MKDITKNELSFVLVVFKTPEKRYNANSISKILGITPMGALKIARKLEKEEIIKGNEEERKRYYEIAKNDYAKDFVRFALKQEREQSEVRGWVLDIKKLEGAKIAIMFGSILTNQRTARDIDVLLVTEQKDFKELEDSIEKSNRISSKKIHPVFQTIQDLKSNIKKPDRVVLNALKGIVVLGEDYLVEELV